MGFYKGASTNRGVDLGVRYTFLPAVDFAVVLRNIGQPLIRTEQIPFTGVAGVSWTGLTSHVDLMGELVGANRIGRSGYDISYRTGARIQLGRPIPIMALAAIDFASDLGIDRLTIGISIGGNRKVLLAGTVVPTAGAADFNQLSVTGVAVDPLGSQQR